MACTFSVSSTYRLKYSTAIISNFARQDAYTGSRYTRLDDLFYVIFRIARHGNHFFGYRTSVEPLCCLALVKEAKGGIVSFHFSAMVCIIYFAIFSRDLDSISANANAWNHVNGALM